jgi:hypothetical protein
MQTFPPTNSAPAGAYSQMDSITVGKMPYAGKYSRRNVAGCRKEGSTPPPGGFGTPPTPSRTGEGRRPQAEHVEYSTANGLRRLLNPT